MFVNKDKLNRDETRSAVFLRHSGYDSDLTNGGQRIEPLLPLEKAAGKLREVDLAAPAIFVWVLEMYDRIAKILVDQGYRGDLGKVLEQVYGCEVEVVERQSEGFQVQPKLGFQAAW